MCIADTQQDTVNSFSTNVYSNPTSDNQCHCPQTDGLAACRNPPQSVMQGAGQTHLQRAGPKPVRGREAQVVTSQGPPTLLARRPIPAPLFERNRDSCQSRDADAADASRWLAAVRSWPQRAREQESRVATALAQEQASRVGRGLARSCKCRGRLPCIKCLALSGSVFAFAAAADRRLPAASGPAPGRAGLTRANRSADNACPPGLGQAPISL